MAATLVFDGDCAFCTSSARWLARRLPPGVEVRPWQRLDLDELGLTEEQVTTAAWWVDGARREGAHLAVGRSLQAAGGVWRPLGWLCRVLPTRWLAAALYRVVAGNRHRLPGGTPACRLDP